MNSPQPFPIDQADQLVGDEPLVYQIGTQVPAEVTPAKPKWELKTVTARHKRIAQMKAMGMTRTDIAKLSKCTPEYVTMLMEQPLIQALMQGHHNAIDQDLRDLTGMAVDSVRTLMDSPDDKVKLSSAALVLKANGKMGATEEAPATTAEDVVAHIFKITNSTVQINMKEPS